MPPRSRPSLNLDALCATGSGVPVALRIIAPSDFPAFLEQATPHERALIAARSLEGKSGEALLLPDPSGGPGRALGLLSPLAAGAYEWISGAARITEQLPAGTFRLDPMPANEALALFALGWLLAQYRFRSYLGNDRPPALRQLAIPDAQRVAEITRQAEAIALVRDLVNMPANDMQPKALEAAARDLAARHRATIDVVVGDALLDRNFPAIHAVGRAAADAPRLIDLRWGDERAPRLTLVGKGVCFDSGGLDIKSASGMRLMKKDMGGAAHVLGLAHLIMASNLGVRLRVLIPAVENAVGAGAFRPGDIIDTRKELSVEIGNTDAEGRLVLADALALADEEAPDLLLDFATLTGAARVALGPDLPALFTADDDLAATLLAAGKAEGDPLWRLPLWQPYRDDIASPIADLLNASDSGFAGAITAALFLETFVERARSWAHIDVYAWNKTNRPGRPAGGEAMTIRAIFRTIRDWSERVS